MKFKNESGTVGGAIAPRKSGSLPKSIKIFSANTNEGEKAPAPSSSRSNVVDTNKDVKSSRDDDVNNNNSEDDDDDAYCDIVNDVDEDDHLWLEVHRVH